MPPTTPSRSPGRPVPFAPFRDAERGQTALLIIDMLGRLEFRAGEAMLPRAQRAADAIVGLRDACEAAGMPVIYVNDNFGQWHSEASRLYAHATEQSSRGRPVAERLRPRDVDYFIIKPQFSGFYATNLPVLLPKLGVSRLILTGLSTDVCVLFTAADAHMRDYQLWVPSDAVAAPTPERSDMALAIMGQSMRAETRPTAKLTLDQWQATLDAEEEALAQAAAPAGNDAT